MYQLKQINYKDIEQYDADYHRRAKDPTIPEDCHWYGVFSDDVLVSYFAVSDVSNDGLFIQRGYVIPAFRQRGQYRNSVWKLSLALLEQAAKDQGYRSIEFVSNRNPLAYSRLFKSTGFKIKYAGFVKNI